MTLEPTDDFKQATQHIGYTIEQLPPRGFPPVVFHAHTEAEAAAHRIWNSMR